MDDNGNGEDFDPDGNAITVISNTDPTNGTVTINADGAFDYTPNANFNGSDSFTYSTTLIDGAAIRRPTLIGEMTSEGNTTIDGITVLPDN